MKCFECEKVLRNKWKYCPNCGKLVGMYLKDVYMLKISDSAQANRIEKKLDDLLKSSQS